jgi:hypothetical protein
MKLFLSFIFCVLFIFNQDKVYSNSRNSHTNQILAKKELDTLINTKHYLILGPKNAHIKITKSLDKYPDFTVLTQYKDDYILIKNKSSENFRIFRKYNPSKSFNDYKVAIYKGTLATPDFNTNTKAKMFITRIKNECRQGINFAGLYTFISIGCGTACQINFLVNRKTGEIYKPFTSSLGVEFKKTSNLLIKNIGAVDLKTNLIEVCTYCVVSLEIWNGEKFIEIE